MAYENAWWHYHQLPGQRVIREDQRIAKVLQQINAAPSTARFMIFASKHSIANAPSGKLAKAKVGNKVLAYKVLAKRAASVFEAHPDSQVFCYVNPHLGNRYTGRERVWIVEDLYAVLDIERNLPDVVTDSETLRIYLWRISAIPVLESVSTSPGRFQVRIHAADLQPALEAWRQHRDLAQTIRPDQFKMPLVYCYHRSKDFLIMPNLCAPVPAREPCQKPELTDATAPDIVKPKAMSEDEVKRSLRQTVEGCFGVKRKPKKAALKVRDMYTEVLHRWGSKLVTGCYLGSRELGSKAGVSHTAAGEFLARLVARGILKIVQPAVMHIDVKIRRPNMYTWGMDHLRDAYAATSSGLALLHLHYSDGRFLAILRDIRSLIYIGAEDDEIVDILVAKQLKSRDSLKFEAKDILIAAQRWRAQARKKVCRNDCLLRDLKLRFHVSS